MTLLIKTPDLQSVMGELHQKFGTKSEASGFFNNDVVVVDFLNEEINASEQQLHALLQTLQCCHLYPVAFRSAQADLSKLMIGLGVMQTSSEPVRPTASGSSQLMVVEQQEIDREVVTDVVHEVPRPEAIVINKPLRSGQRVYARGTDLVLLSVVNRGAEAVADGNVHVYAPLRGKAVAGANGNIKARIFAKCMDPELVAIAGIYYPVDVPLADDIRDQPAQVYLSCDGQDRLLFEAMNG